MTDSAPRDPAAAGDPPTTPPATGDATPGGVPGAPVAPTPAPVAPTPAPAPVPFASADALADPAGTTAAMDLAPAPDPAGGIVTAGAGAPLTPALEPVEPVADVVTHPVAASTGRGGGAARIVGYLVAAIAGGAIVFAALAIAGKVTVGSATEAASPSPSVGGTVATSGLVASTGTEIPGGAPVLGDAGAPVLIEVWADYQCPYCGLLTHAVEPAIVREFVETGQARLVYRDFAFLGEESGSAAGAARCAGQQGAYWRFHDLLFASQQGENQGAFAPKNLIQLAGFAGLDANAFAACLDEGSTVKAAMAETEEGRALGIESTPTLHVVGPRGTKLVKGLVPMSSVEEAVTFALTGVEPSPTPAPSTSGAPAGSPATSTAPGSSGSSAAPSASAAP